MAKGLGRFRGLGSPAFGVGAAGGDQGGVGTGLDDAAGGHDADSIGEAGWVGPAPRPPPPPRAGVFVLVAPPPFPAPWRSWRRRKGAARGGGGAKKEKRERVGRVPKAG